MSIPQIVKVNSLDLYTESFGLQKNTPILLISGAGASSLFWTDDFCKSLTESNYSVIRFDHRDCGLSSSVNYDRDPYTVHDLAKDALAILDAYNIKKAFVVGHSMGGIIAQILGLDYPERILGFASISVGTVQPFASPSEKTMKRLMKNLPAGDFEKDLPGFMNSWRILNGKAPLDVEMAESYTRDLYERTNHPVGVAWSHIKAQENLPDFTLKLQKCTVPALFIHGEDDPLIPIENGENTARNCKNSSFKAIPKMGHMIFNEQIQAQILENLKNWMENPAHV